MHIAIPAERLAGEHRVAATPETVKKLVAGGHAVTIERGAGLAAALPDAAYQEAGAAIAADRAAALAQADIVLTVRPLDEDGIAALKDGASLIGQLNPYHNHSLPALAAKRISAYALELCRAAPARRAWTCSPARTISPATARCCWPPSITRASCPC